MRSRKGFTLVEMLAVVIIVALLASIIFPAVGNAITRNAAATNAANLRAVEGQLRILRHHIICCQFERFHRTPPNFGCHCEEPRQG